MADMMDTLKELLGDNAEEKLGAVMGALNGSGSESGGAAPTPILPPSGAISPDLLMQAQGLIKQLSSAGTDTRARLLLSLKPYMRQSRQTTIDSAIKLLNIARLSQFFKGNFLGQGGI